MYLTTSDYRSALQCLSWSMGFYSPIVCVCVRVYEEDFWFIHCCYHPAEMGCVVNIVVSAVKEGAKSILPTMDSRSLAGVIRFNTVAHPPRKPVVFFGKGTDAKLRHFVQGEISNSITGYLATKCLSRPFRDCVSNNVFICYQTVF